MRFAVQTRERSFEDYQAAARWADACSIEAFAVADHYLAGAAAGDGAPVHDALTLLAGIAGETRSVDLVSLVSPVTFRHPAVLAKSAATIQEIAGGRFSLGLGTGWMEEEHTAFGLPFPDRATRFEMLEEALGYLRAVFADPPVPFEGRHYRFDGTDVQPRPRLRLVVGGQGAEVTPRLAGTFADEYNLVLSDEGTPGERIARAREAAAAAGRDPDRLLVSCASVVVTGSTEAEYRHALDRLARRLGRPADDLAASLASRNAPHGTWEQVREGMAALEEAGVERFYFQTVGGVDPPAIRRLVTALGA